MKRLNGVVILLAVLALISNCGKQAVKEEPVKEQAIEKKVEKQQPSEQKPAVVETTKVETAKVETTTAVEAPVPEEEKVKETKGKLEEVLEVAITGDSIDVMYMVRPNDYLIKIAKNEYGVAWMWKKIYAWNIDKIGDNPNLIYPFNEFLLKKPRDKANPVKYEFYDYEVKPGETLWSIAGKEYGNNYAWIVILHDNADVLNFDLEKLPPGTILKLRTKLW